MFSRKAVELDKTSQELYDLACQNIRKNKNLLQNLSQECNAEDLLYERNARSNALHETETNTCKQFSKDISDSLKGLYTNHFAKTNSSLRHYYDSIMGSWCKEPKTNKCPYCGIGKLSELDHFLPESNFGLLVINPKNLIPSCHECNKKKSNYFSLANNHNLLHPYYDDVTNYQWLECELEIIDRIIVVNFFCSNPNDQIPPEIFERINFMFSKLEINEQKYLPYLSDELTLLHDRFTAHEGKYYSLSDQEILIDLQSTFMEAKRNFGNNHCKTVLYKHLLKLPNFKDLRP